MSNSKRKVKRRHVARNAKFDFYMTKLLLIKNYEEMYAGDMCAAVGIGNTRKNRVEMIHARMRAMSAPVLVTFPHNNYMEFARVWDAQQFDNNQ